MNLKEEIRDIDSSKKKLREFGLLIGGILLGIAALLWWRKGIVSPYLTVSGGVLFVCGVLVPSWLKYLYLGWMILAHILGWTVSRIILTVLFFVVITPLGILTRFRGKDFLDLKLDKKGGSYWVAKKPEENAKEACEKQF